MYLPILHLPKVELHCKLQEKLHRVTGHYVDGYVTHSLPFLVLACAYVVKCFEENRSEHSMTFRKQIQLI